MKMNKLTAALISTLLVTAPLAHAQFSVNVGAIHVNPIDSASAINENRALGLAADSDTQLGITFDYHYNDNIVIELVAATPFSHTVEGAGGLAGNDIATIKHLPPTLLAQYHFFDSSAKLRPFIGAGLNYTVFFDEEPTAALKQTLGTDNVKVDLDNSFGLALQLGLNYEINDKWGLHVMVSKMDIDTDATVYADGKQALTSDVEIDPFVAMIGAKYKF
ncbi:OmpW family outer membrane protein [Pseudoalteromonas sp. P94(2023)]|uniref:OmpW family outer membrane protein n=2 Tax=Pseudoalteromonas TaxID=53246 RepID=A0ABT7EMR4_9GAMM|nr:MULTISPECIES: OmpW family outer membrane protein [Pseudoalteromonas]MBQ4838884.1 outer membrane beta-barrel protein [Pseudoalteromonas luteoviolacea]MDK2596303.1 OmpW family outer membrane protein [Pseudoalteromonas sp. P94(2023)]